MVGVIVGVIGVDAETTDAEGGMASESRPNDTNDAGNPEEHVPSAAHEPPPAPCKKRFMEGCDAAADEFWLTPREKELMILYAKGHTSANIQQELFLSRGTVTTHLRHIYQKMDIHSKTELVALIEARRC